jgi:hypothetical protein
LYAKISDLENELDRDRTKFDAYGALVIEFAGVVGDVAEKLEPVRRWLDTIAKFFGVAKSHEDANRQLPSPPKPKQLNPPKKQRPRSLISSMMISLFDWIQLDHPHQPIG